MASHISHVAFNSASDAFVDGTVLDPGGRIGVDGEEGDKDGESVLSHEMPSVERVGEIGWKIEGS